MNVTAASRLLRSCALLLATGLPVAARASIMFSDGTFDDGDWTLSIYNFTTTTPGGGSSVATRMPADGNPGDYRQVSITVYSAVGQASVNGIYSLNLRSTAVYDPQVHGAVASIDWSLDSNVLSIPPEFSLERGVLLRQDGIYFIPYSSGGNTSGWVTTARTGLQAHDFFSLNGVASLDLSSTASPITFGFYEFCFTRTHYPGYTAVSGVDNWSVAIQQVPEPGGGVITAGAILLLGGLGPRRRRRRRVNCPKGITGHVTTIAPRHLNEISSHPEPRRIP